MDESIFYNYGKVLDKPHNVKGAELCVREWRIKVNVSYKNIKYEKNI